MIPSRPMAVDERPSDRPYALGQVVDDAFGGRFLVLRVDGKDTSGHWRYRVARDFTRPLDAQAYRSTELGPERLQQYELNYAINKPHVKLSAGRVPTSDIVYLVGSGPSLRKNIGELERITRGVVVGVNQTPALIPTGRMDYFFCIDYSLDGSHWKGRMKETVGIFDVAVTPAVRGGDFREMRWFLPTARSAFYDRARAEFPDLVLLEHGLNVTYTALCWIVRVLKASTIVLVGMDCAFPDGMKHFDEPLRFERDAEYLVAPDVNGCAVITNRVYLDIAEWHQAAFYFLREAGIRVVNATEGGVLKNYVELRRLGDVVAELEAQQVPKCLSS